MMAARDWCAMGAFARARVARLEDEAQCLLVIIGATFEGKKELVGLIGGVRAHNLARD